jgi:hypothetical protein
MDSTVSAATDKTGTERPGCHAPVRSPRDLAKDPGDEARRAGRRRAALVVLRLICPFAGKAIPEPVSRAW